MKGKLVFVLLLTAAFSGVVSAQSYYPMKPLPYGPAETAERPDPAAILEQGLQKLMAFADRPDRPGGDEAAAFLEQEIAPYFDFAYMARWAGGRIWHQMAPGQRRELERSIQQDFLTTLASRLTSFDGQQVRIIRSRLSRGGDVDVAVVVLNPGSYPAQLNFRFYPSSEGWKVFDVSANGSSAIMHYRNRFNQMIYRGRPIG